jgi:hypothetical protein
MPKRIDDKAELVKKMQALERELKDVKKSLKLILQRSGKLKRSASKTEDEDMVAQMKKKMGL